MTRRAVNGGTASFQESSRWVGPASHGAEADGQSIPVRAEAETVDRPGSGTGMARGIPRVGIGQRGSIMIEALVDPAGQPVHVAVLGQDFVEGSPDDGLGRDRCATSGGGPA